MLSLKHPLLLPMLLALPLAVSGCATQVEMKPLFPSSADLQVKPKPQPTDAIVTDAQAAAAYDAAVETWGEDGWAQVARLCRWAVSNGDKLTFACPAPPVQPK